MSKHHGGGARQSMTQTKRPAQERVLATTNEDGHSAAQRQESSAKNGQLTALVGVALTILGVLGYGAGRAYVRTYWTAHGVSSQFSLSIQDFVYYGYLANVGHVGWAFFVVVIACVILMATIEISNWLRRRLATQFTWFRDNGSNHKVRDEATAFFGKVTFVAIVAFFCVSGAWGLMRASADAARARVEAERGAFVDWGAKQMSELDLVFAVVAGNDTVRQQCGFVVEGSDKLLALSDGTRTEFASTEGRKLQTWALRFSEKQARVAAACDCGFRTKPKVECPPTSASSPSR